MDSQNNEIKRIGCIFKCQKYYCSLCDFQFGDSACYLVKEFKEKSYIFGVYIEPEQRPVIYVPTDRFIWSGEWTDGIDHNHDDYGRFVMIKKCKNCGESLGIHAEEGKCTKNNRKLLCFDHRGGMFQDGSYEHEGEMMQDGSYR